MKERWYILKYGILPCEYTEEDFKPTTTKMSMSHKKPLLKKLRLIFLQKWRADHDP